jgi:hypothetical protein
VTKVDATPWAGRLPIEARTMIAEGGIKLDTRIEHGRVGILEFQFEIRRRFASVDVVSQRDYEFER